MLTAATTLAVASLSNPGLHTPGIAVVPDAILRTPGIDATYTLQAAFGGNLTQSMDGNGNLLSAIASSSGADASYPAANVISGSNVHYNPSVDLDNNWWGFQATSGQVTIDLGSVRSLNGIRVFFHPLLPTCNSFTILFSNDNITFMQLTEVDFWSTSLYEVNLPTNVTARYIKFQANNCGVDGWIRIVQIEVYNWVDISAQINDQGGAAGGSNQPDLVLSYKSSSTQSSLPTPSELQVNLINVPDPVTGAYFSEYNTLSPIYGITQADGRGSGIRNGIPVRLYANAVSATASFTKKIFEGYIQNNDSSGGASALVYDDLTQTAMMVCKSVMTRLDAEIITPSYTAAFFHVIAKDICYRCGIADPFINIQPIMQMVPFASLGQTTGTAAINSLLQGLPFADAYETYDPVAQFNIVNTGRTRMDATFSNYITGGVVDTAFDSSGNMWILESQSSGSNFLLNIWKWNMSLPTDTGMTLYNSFTDSTFLNGFYRLRVSNYGFVIVTTLSVDSACWKVTSTSVTLLGTFFAAGNYGITQLETDGRFLWAVGTRIAGGSWSLGVWDMSLSFNTRRSNINLPATASYLGVDSNYVVLSYAANQYQVGFYNGAPYSWVATFNLMNTSNLDTVGNNAWYDILTQNLYIVSNKAVSDGTFHIYSMNAPAAWAAGGSGIAPTDLGTTGKLSSHTTVTETAVTNGYCIFLLSDGTMWVYNTATLGPGYFMSSGVQKSISVVASFPITVRSMHTCQFPYSSKVYPIIFYAPYFPNWSGNTSTTVPTVTGFFFVNPYISTTPIGTFSSTDGFTSDMQLADGSPEANRVQIYTSPSTAASAASQLWAQPVTAPLSFPQGVITTVAIPLPASLRGSSSSKTRRFLNVGASNFPTFPQSGGTVVNDDPTSYTNVTINSVVYPVKFFAYGQVGYISIDLTGGQAALSLSSLQIIGTALSGATATLAIDQTDQISKRLYGGQEYVLVLNTAFFNNPSQYLDLLLDGKYAKLWAQQIDLPWYPIMPVASRMTVSDPLVGVSAMTMKVLESVTDGFVTTLKGKQIYPSFTI